METVWRIAEYLEQGGWIMIPLAAVSIAMWTLIVGRVRAYRALVRADLDLGGALAALEQGAAPPAASRGLRGRLVREFLRERSGHPRLDRDILRQIARAQRTQLATNLSVIGMLATVAPLLGLLGTVLGMIETFDVISLFGTGNAKAMAGGISVALVTTQAGLLVAIPGLFLSNALVRQARRLETRLDEFASIMERHVGRAAAPAGGRA